MTQGIEGNSSDQGPQAEIGAAPAYYPVYRYTDEAGRPADPEFDLGLPTVLDTLVMSGLASIRCGRPVLAAERDALLAKHPEMAAPLGWDGSAEPQHVLVPAITGEEARARSAVAMGAFIAGAQRHTNGDAQSSMVKWDYDGDLFGAPLRIGGLTHR